MIVFGFHALEETLKKESVKGTLLISRKNPKTDHLKGLARRIRIQVIYVHEKELNQICGSDRHQGAALRVDRISEQAREDFRSQLGSIAKERVLILLLDEINDPQNFGAILRSADQFAIDMVVIPTRRAVGETQTVLKTSSGASAYVSVFEVSNLVQAIKLCKKENFWIYGAHLKGKRVDSLNFQGRIALVMGSEDKGLRRLVKDNCDVLVRIPSSGHIDSFNVSVAAGILMYEIRKQQGFPF